jgi:hypothetical protein
MAGEPEIKLYLSDIFRNAPDRRMHEEVVGRLRNDVKGHFALEEFILSGCNAGVILENAAKMSLVVKPGLVGNMGKCIVPGMNQPD